MSTSQVTLDNFPFNYSEGEVEETDAFERNDDHPSHVIEELSFHCTSCSYQTAIESLYDRHVAKHALVAPYLCPSCTYSDYDRGAFVDHMMMHQQSRILRCNFCNYKSITASMRVHLLKHGTVDILDCSMCEFSTNYPNSMKQHVDAYHIREYVCDYCQNVMSKYSLIKHSWNAHGVVIKSKLKSLNELGYGLEESELDVPIKSEMDFDSYTNEKIPVQDEALTAIRRTAQEKYDGKWIGKFDCEFCDFTTKYFYSKKFHVEKFHTKLFMCGHCDSVMTKHQLAEHYKEAHGQDINLKHCRRFVEVSSDPTPFKPVENSSTAQCSGPSIVEAVKSASRKLKKKNGTSELQKPPSEAETSTKDSGTQQSSPIPKSQEIGEEPSSPGCGPPDPFALSIAEAVKSKSRKAKRKHALALSTKDFPRKSGHNENLALKTEPLLAMTMEPPTRDIGTSVEEDFISSELPSLEPEVQSVRESHAEFLHCSKCQFTTRLKSVMRHHVLAHLPESCLVCPKCSFSCDINYEFARHLRTHSDGDAVPCCFCSYTVPVKALGNLGNHLGTHRKVGSFFCSRCSYSCAVKQPLKDHIRVHHSEKYQCPECRRVGTKFLIMKHMKQCHQSLDSKPNVKVTKDKTVSVDQIDGNGVPYANEGNPSCDDAGNLTSDVGMDSAAAGLPGASDSSNQPENQFQNLEKTSGLAASSNSAVVLKHGRLYCSDCPYNTKKKKLLRKHVAKHLLEGSFFTCPTCHFKDNNPYEFVLHLKSHDSRPTSCCFCGYGFRNYRGVVSQYASHLEAHRPVHFIDCPNCERSFKRINHLKSHYYNNHVCKRKCPECNKIMTRYMLLRHIAKHESSKKKTICGSHIGNAIAKMSNPSCLGANVVDPGTSARGYVDDIVGESFGVPLSPESSRNSRSPQKGPKALYWNDGTTLFTNRNLDKSEACSKDSTNSDYLPNSVKNFDETSGEDLTNVPIFDISDPSLIRSSTQNSADSQKRKGNSIRLGPALMKPLFWDPSGFTNVFDLAENAKNDGRCSDSGSESTATGGEESDRVGVTTLSGVHFLDHSYAAYPRADPGNCSHKLASRHKLKSPSHNTCTHNN